MSEKKSPRSLPGETGAGERQATGLAQPNFRSEEARGKVFWMYEVREGAKLREVWAEGFPGVYGAQRVSVEEDDQGGLFQRCWTQYHVKLDEDKIWIEPTRPHGNGWKLHRTIDRPHLICWEWRRPLPEEGPR